MPRKILVGVDEVGRGPIAGPVGVCALAIFDSKVIDCYAGIKDSKKISAKKREVWCKKMEEDRYKGWIDFSVALIAPKYIDRRGIVSAINLGIMGALSRLKIRPENCTVLLDGGLFAPEEFTDQKTIIGGDNLERVISMASVAGKVYRDKEMCRLSLKYPGYGFDIHKGYGTSAHYEAIKKNGFCPIHRRSFLKKLAV